MISKVRLSTTRECEMRRFVYRSTKLTLADSNGGEIVIKKPGDEQAMQNLFCDHTIRDFDNNSSH